MVGFEKYLSRKEDESLQSILQRLSMTLSDMRVKAQIMGRLINIRQPICKISLEVLPHEIPEVRESLMQYCTKVPGVEVLSTKYYTSLGVAQIECKFNFDHNYRR